MLVGIRAAKTRLSKLIDAALDGEDVVITKGGKPLVRLVPVSTNGFVFDLLVGRVKGPGSDFFEPMSEEELVLWEGGHGSTD